jgi:predicted acyltransferase
MQANRYLSLDVFRGLTIAGMILVNTPGNDAFTYAPLHHARWHGFTPTDLVFPSFLFIVGVAMRFSFKAYQYELTPTLRAKILRRTALIFGIGYLVHTFPYYDFHLAHLRVLGVLQRIALCYLGASLLALLLSRRQLLLVSAGILVGYWLLLAAFGDYELTTNAVRRFDLWLMGPNHLYHGEGLAFDPEGWLSTLPALVTVLLGYLTGQAIQQADDKDKLIVQMVLWGVVLTVAALVWNVVFPINKKLWTSPYVLLSAGIDLLILPVLIWAIDGKGWRGWTLFFVVFGANSIVAYALSEVLAVLLWHIPVTEANGFPTHLYPWLYWHIFQPVFGHYPGSLAFAVTFVLVCWVVCYGLYRRKIFLKV